MKILDRYIIRELLDPFAFGLGAFTLIMSASMVLFQLVRAVVVNGMPFIVAVQLFLFKLPSIVIYIFPMATLLATLLAIARLSGDSELIAFRAAGVSLYRLVAPIFAFGLVISLVSLLFYEVVVPEGNRAATELTAVTRVEKAPKIQENVFVPEIENGVLKRIFFARRMSGGEMEGVLVQEFQDGRLSQLVNAKTAKYEGREWLFRDGTIYILSDVGEYKHLIKFDEQRVAIKFSPSDFQVDDRSPEEMNFRELAATIRKKEKMGLDLTDLKIQLHYKVAIPFASLVFTLLGAPLGLNPTRRSSSIGLGLSVIVLFFYYLLMFLSMSAAQLRYFPPVVAAWLPNIATGGAGLYILSRRAS